MTYIYVYSRSECDMKESEQTPFLVFEANIFSTKEQKMSTQR